MDNAQKSRLMEHQSDTAIKQQQHMHFPQSSFPTYGNPSGNYPPGSNPNMNISSQLQMRQGPLHPTMGSQPMNPMSLSERQNVINEMNRMHPGGLAHFANNSPNSGHWQQSMGYGKPDSMDQMNNQQHKSQGIEQVSGSSKDDTFEMSSRPGFSTPMNKPEPMSITAQLERQNAVISSFFYFSFLFLFHHFLNTYSRLLGTRQWALEVMQRLPQKSQLLARKNHWKPLLPH